MVLRSIARAPSAFDSKTAHLVPAIDTHLEDRGRDDDRNVFVIGMELIYHRARCARPRLRDK